MNEPYDELEPWCAALSARTEQDIARYAPVPDFADVLARMQQDEDDATFGPGDDSQFAQPPSNGVVPLARARALTTGADPALAPFVEALRARVENGLRERAMLAIPSLPTRPNHLRWAVGAALAIAAAGVLWVAMPPRLFTQDDDGQANAAAQSLGATTDAPAWETARTKPARRSTSTEQVARDTQAPAEIVAPTPEHAPKRSHNARGGDDLDALEREADAAWAAGDLAGAERALRRVINLGGRSHRVELAYGDLFAVSKQRHGGAGQLAIWREYLRKFPRGRFADDARAGICRSDSTDGANDCWRGYVAAHPDGSHLAEARRRIAREGDR